MTETCTKHETAVAYILAKVVVTFYLILINEFQSSDLSRQNSGLWLVDLLGQPIRGLVFGGKWQEFISQSQIKGNYNFSICTVFKFEFFWHKLRVVVSKGFDACIRVSRKKTGFNISWKYIHEILLPDFFSVKKIQWISFILLLVIIFNEMLVVLCEMKFNLNTQWNNRCRF